MLAGLISLPVFAEVKVPELTGPVIDEAGLLSAQDIGVLNEELASYPPTMQLQIWILKSLEGEDIASVGIRAGDKWKLGEKKTDRGIILLVAPTERKMRIEVGRGLEGNIPDTMSGRITDGILRPYFKQGAYAQGLLAASQSLYKLAGGTVTEKQVARREKSEKGSPLFTLLFVLAFLIFGFIGSRGRSRFGRSIWIGGGGFGGGSGGGGGWSGGGGSFGGGGSSGSW